MNMAIEGLLLLFVSAMAEYPAPPQASFGHSPAFAVQNFEDVYPTKEEQALTKNSLYKEMTGQTRTRSVRNSLAPEGSSLLEVGSNLIPNTGLVQMQQQMPAQFGASVVPGLPTTNVMPVYGGIYDNPGTNIKLTPILPEEVDCTVRPQTVLEVARMRKAAARIAMAIDTELGVMKKRKSYVEQMTSYLNDRIRELNKVKSDLQAETRWIELSNQRILQISEKEKLIKMQDVLSCLNGGKKSLDGSLKYKQNSIKEISTKATALEKNIAGINKKN